MPSHSSIFLCYVYPCPLCGSRKLRPSRPCCGREGALKVPMGISGFRGTKCLLETLASDVGTDSMAVEELHQEIISIIANNTSRQSQS